MTTPIHHPILFDSNGAEHPSVFQLLDPKPGDIVLDCTLGLGGHTEKFLELTGEDGEVIGLDTDEENLQLAVARHRHHPNFSAVHANFRNLAELDLPKANVIFADLGLSSAHVDLPERGFSFRSDGPLDLRFDRKTGQTGADLLRHSSLDELTKLLREFGELSQARMLAKAIVKHREEGHTINTTSDLRSVIEETLKWESQKVLPQVFQALRMALNDELQALHDLLDAIPDQLLPGGRVGILTFHSLEDRIVKQTFKAWCTAEKDPQTGQDLEKPPFLALTKKPIVPSSEEIVENPRSRSAKFRAVRKQGSL